MLHRGTNAAQGLKYAVMERNPENDVAEAAPAATQSAARAAAQRPTGLAPAQWLAGLEAAAQRVQVPTASGTSVWRRWGAGPPLLLLHGGTGSWRHWVLNLQALSASYTVWAPDMPGYGDSADAPAGAGPAELAEGLSQALDVAIAGDAPVDLIGFSFGGVVAAHLAARRPDRIRRLMLVGAVGLGALRNARDQAMQRWRGLADEQAQRAAHRHNLAVLMIADPARIDDLAIEIQCQNAARTRFFSRGASRGQGLIEALQQVTLPVCGIWGRHDATSSGGIETALNAFHQVLPQASSQVIDDAGHWVQYESAPACNAAMLDWLAQGAGAPPA